MVVNNNKKRILLLNQGCRLNHAETGIIQGQLETIGHNIVSDINDADTVIINTCTVTENGDKDTKRIVKKLVNQNKNIRVALIGCQAQILKDKLFELPNVHWVIGNEQKMSIPYLLEQEKSTSLTEKIQRNSFTLPFTGIDKRHVRANLKIQDGCDFYCSFCVIPFARGPARSREFDDILNEAKSLVESGHQELVLTGINLGTYFNQDKSLLDVVYALEAIDDLKRIRISSIEPTTISKKLILHMGKKDSKLCPYLHIPVQSCSDSILKAMNRHYNMHEYRQFLDFCLENVPNICIGTDIIVGFPGESKQNFDEMVAHILTINWHYAHVFSYSERQFARSQKFINKINQSEIKRRSRVIQSIFFNKRLNYQANFIGSKVNVLFEQEKNGYWHGTTDTYIKVAVKSNHRLKNKFHAVKLLKNDSVVFGQLIN